MPTLASTEENHVVQFYEDEQFLCDVVARFAGGGLIAGEPVVVFATEARRAALCDRLRERSVDVDRACRTGRLILRDARQALSKLMTGGRPDRERFRALVAAALADARAGREQARVRIYGELVDLLCRDDNRAAAMELEELWNELGRSRSLALLCAYEMDRVFKASDAEQLAQLCGLHSHVLPTEPVGSLDEDPTHRREIALLEQRALALSNELECHEQREHELRLADRRLTEFVENAVVPFRWLAPDGKILWANQAELDLVGYSRDEYVGHHIAEFHIDRPVADEMMARLGRRELLREYPARLRCKDGTTRYVVTDTNVLVENGQLVHTRCFTRDLTPRRQAEQSAREKDAQLRNLAIRKQADEKLRESEMRMSLLIASIRDYAIFMLDPTGHIATWNPGAQRIKGWEASEIIGRHFSSFYPESDVKAGKCEFELRVASQTGRFEDEAWRLRKDGSRFWANVVISAVRDQDGTLLGFAKVTRDLTDRRRAEDERAALAAAEQANRAKDEFLAMLGHELRNPLAPIVTALQLMKLRGDVRSSNEQIVIERQVQHVVRLVDDLLDVSRITRGKVELKRETIELAEVVAKAVEIASPLLEQRRHDFFVDVPREGMRVDGDPVRLAQVLANLIMNAAKYTEAEGNIAVTAWRDGHEIVIQVKDNGLGIRPELLPQIFDLFVQGPRASDRAEGGLGLGLALVRSLVQMHGGTVVALSEGPGKGSAFVVRLPAATSPAKDKEPTASPPRLPAASHPRRVLVVDDNVDAAALLGELLEMMGHEVKVAHDGPQALGLLGGFAPEVAVLDIGLPVMDGYELAQGMRERLGSSCRLIALTGYGQEHDRRRSHAAGFEAHLVKPVDPARMLRLIDEGPAPGSGESVA